MRLLLDTHILLWWLRDNPLLRPKPRAIIADSVGEVLFSVVSCWEASVKYRIGKMELSGSDLFHLAVEERFLPLGLEVGHLEELDRLPRVTGHGDPFDHLLLAQAKWEKATLMTHDREMTRYGVNCVGVR